MKYMWQKELHCTSIPQKKTTHLFGAIGIYMVRYKSSTLQYFKYYQVVVFCTFFMHFCRIFFPWIFCLQYYCTKYCSQQSNRGRNELCQFRFSFLGPFFQIWQFFVVLHKIGHECIMTLHGRFTKITKKSKHGNVYNDRSTKK